MNSIKTIVKFEFMRYFISPLAYVYLVCFLLLSGSCAIYFGNFFMNGQANLWGLFDYQPWIYLLFIPGISMRSWAEEFRSKSVIQILTTPVSISNLVCGKFLASWLFSIFAICLTFPFWITVNYLGNPDNTVIFINYLGCFILAGAMLAISQTMSSLTKNPVISLVLAVFVNLLFFWSGFDYVLFWARELFNDIIVDTIISFSFLTHFSSFSRGLVELRDVVFFGTLIVFFNLTTIMVVSLKTKGTSGLVSSSSTKHVVTVFSLLFLGFFGLNIIANNLLREISYDFTEEKYLSLTKNTKDILRKLPRPVVARLYYSPVLGQRNPEIRQMFERIKLMLRQYKTYGNGKFDFKIYNPKFLDEIEDKAIADGLQPIPLIDINQNALFGLTLSDDLINKSVIPFFAIERFSFLEQDLTTNIYKMHHKKKSLGIYSKLPIEGDAVVDGVSLRKWELLKSIEMIYDVTIIKNEEDLDKNYDVFMLIHPYALKDSEIEKIKKQKKIFLMLDVADEASKLYSPYAGKYTPSHLGSLADYWGIEFYDIGVAADFDNSITVDETINYKTNPSFTQDLLQFRLTNKDFNPNHRTTYNLNSILFSSATMVMPKRGAPVTFVPLIKSSNNSTLMDVSFVTENKHPREILNNFQPSNSVIILAAEFLSNDLKKPFDIIAVGDTDFAYDAFWMKSHKFMEHSYNIPIFDSANFVLNSLDYLSDNDDLIRLRGKNIKSRPLYKVENMRKANIYKYKLKENDIFQAIDGVRQSLYEVAAKKDFEERDIFNVDELAVIGNMRAEINRLRQQLSDLRLNAHQDIEKLEIKVKFFNIYFLALLIILLSSIYAFKNKKLKLCNILTLLRLDKQIIKLSIWILGIMVLAAGSIYLDTKNNISTYENKPVFEEFSQVVNDIEIIKLKQGKNVFTFYNDNHIWKLKEYPQFLIYQERIRKFLIAISRMFYFEKKSDRIEDLKYFGFSTDEDEKSKMISVSLEDKKGNQINGFDIGYYDFNLGRGSRGAFIKLINEFQVWMINADFYNLDLDVNAWSYSSLWNLRYGRLISYNKVTSSVEVMNFVKTLLNVSFIDVKKSVKAKEIDRIGIFAENNNIVDLVFHRTKDNRIFVTYEFMSLPQGKHLTLFAEYAKDNFFEISNDDWIKIKNEYKKK